MQVTVFDGHVAALVLQLDNARIGVVGGCHLKVLQREPVTSCNRNDTFLSHLVLSTKRIAVTVVVNLHIEIVTAFRLQRNGVR